MKHFKWYATYIFLFLFSVNVNAQDQEDPLAGNYELGSLGNEKQLFMLWNEFQPSATNTYQKIFRLEHPGMSSVAEFDSSITQTRSGLSGDRKMDIISADFTGDFAEDIVAVWEESSATLGVMIPAINPETSEWETTPVNKLDLDGDLLIAQSTTGRQFRLAPGNFRPDQESEFVLAYFSNQNVVKLIAYDVGNNLTAGIIASADAFGFPFLDPLSNDYEEEIAKSQRFALGTGDFNGDEIDEIVIASSQQIDCDGSRNNCWELSLQIHGFDVPTSTITTPLVQHSVYQDMDGQWLHRIDLEVGDFDNDDEPEIAIGYALTDGDESSWWLQFVDVESTDAGFSATQGDGVKQDQTNGNVGYPLSLEAGDLDMDGDDELVYAARTLDIFSADSSLQANVISGETIYTEYHDDSHRIVSIADLDSEYNLAQGDTLFRPEIVIANNLVRENDSIISLRAFQYTPGQFSLEEIASIEQVFDDNKSRTLFITHGGYDNNSMRLATPRRFARTEINEPIAIINAPPTHFDVIDGTPYDISRCYNQNECFFSATYQSQTEQTIVIETKFNSDWSIGAGGGGGIKIPLLKVNVGAKFQAKYGEHFSKTDGAFETYSVSQSVDAIADDWIYAVTMLYDIWEYPILVNDEIEGYVTVVVPQPDPQRKWFDSKSFDAVSYIPKHEVGNILSYSDIASPDENAFLAEEVRWETGDGITLNNNSNITWTLTRESGELTSSAFREEKQLEGSVDFNLPLKFLPGVDLDGDYNDSNISTYTSQVWDQTGLSVQLDAIDLSVGNTRYAVTPYVYWATNGALVLDYAVRPELSSNPAEPETWWTTTYGKKPDPTFILPWRLDPEKGLGISNEEDRFLTRDIQFSPSNLIAGEVATIQARIQNFSLVPTAEPVTVQFYLDNPDAGGRLLENTAGMTMITTENAIAARDVEIVSFEWLVPENVDSFTRLYAVLDADNQIDEIHESNNRGWAVLEVESINTSNEDDLYADLEFALHQNYPNPFASHTTVEYSISSNTHVTMVVLDILGRQVARVVDAQQSAGSYSVPFLADRLSSGVYILKLQAEGRQLTRKMLVVK